MSEENKENLYYVGNQRMDQTVGTLVNTQLAYPEAPRRQQGSRTGAHGVQGVRRVVYDAASSWFVPVIAVLLPLAG